MNPMTGEGIFYAVLSGALAGVSARRGVAAGAAYRRALRRHLAGHLRHTATAARLARTLGVVDAAVQAAGDDQLVFDDLVDLGLGDGRLRPRTLGAIGRSYVSARPRRVAS